MPEGIKGLIRAHLKKAAERLRAATRLVESGFYDDAVSRAYYAAFFAAHGLLLSEDLRPRSHAGVVNLVGAHFVKTGLLTRDLGRRLTRLKETREVGDYEVLSRFSVKSARLAIEDATVFIHAVQEYLAGAGWLPKRAGRRNRKSK